jgi:putative protease
MNKHKPELVLPGGDLQRAKIAFNFGADAVYVGLNKYSLRKGEVRFDIPEIGKAIDYAHSLNKKLYVTFNIFAHNEHLKLIERDLAKIAKLKPDAFIIADVGVMQIAKRIAPKIPLHVSTQANTTNIEDVKFWQSIGAKRIVLAREMTLKEIAAIHKAVPNIELEVFAHGSMCISYSGRCLLSNYMTGRHANLGDCAQPCRWNYRVKQLPIDQSLIPNDGVHSEFFLEEKMRPGEYFPIEETENGTNIMSSKDLRTIEYLDKMIAAGITGFKVEGRNKTEYYLASTALAYREGLDLASANNYKQADKKRLSKDLEKIAHRGYTSGFLFGDAKEGETYEGRSPIQKWEYVGQIINSQKPAANSYQIIVKNKIEEAMLVEVLTPTGIYLDQILEIVVDEEVVSEINPGKEQQKAYLQLKSGNYKTGSLLRAPGKTLNR